MMRRWRAFYKAIAAAQARWDGRIDHSRVLRYGETRMAQSGDTHVYTIEIHPAEEGEKGYWVSVPALPGCFSQGETYDEAVSHAQEAIECYLEALVKRGESIPEESSHPKVLGVQVALPQTA